MNEKIFVDSNTVLDFLIDRAPFSEAALALFILAENRKIELFVSAGSFDTLYYVLRKNSVSHADSVFLLKNLNRITRMVAVDKSIVENALESDFVDFEDAVQYYCAKKVKGLKTIISRDKKGFGKARLTVVSAEEYINSIN